MTRLWVLTALLIALAVVAGCGPDCDKYCRKVQDCRSTCLGASIDVGACVTACDNSGSSRSNTIQCVIDHTCKEIAAGDCSVTGASGFQCGP